jgi:hypothetical protein
MASTPGRMRSPMTSSDKDELELRVRLTLRWQPAVPLSLALSVSLPVVFSVSRCRSWLGLTADSMCVCVRARRHAAEQHPLVHERPPGLCPAEDRRPAAPARAAQDPVAAASQRGGRSSGGSHSSACAGGGRLPEQQGGLHYAARQPAQGGAHHNGTGPNIAPRGACTLADQRRDLRPCADIAAARCESRVSVRSAHWLAVVARHRPR